MVGILSAMHQLNAVHEYIPLRPAETGLHGRRCVPRRLPFERYVGANTTAPLWRAGFLRSTIVLTRASDTVQHDHDGPRSFGLWCEHGDVLGG